MKTIALANLYKRIIIVASVFSLLFSSTLVFGQNTTPDPTSNPLSIPFIQSTDREFDSSESDIALIKTGVFDDANNNGVANVGELVHYSFSVKNTGDTELTDIRIDDPLINVVGSLSSLSPGQVNNSSFSANYPVTQVDINNGFVENQATATACFDAPFDTEGNCEGKVTYLKLEYQGDVGNAQIKVIENDGQTIFDAVVQPGQQFEFFGQDGNPPTMGPKIYVYINNSFNREIHTSCSQPIGIGSVFGDFEVIDGASRIGGPFIPVTGNVCSGEVTDLSDNDVYSQDDPTIVPLPYVPPTPTPRECGCAPFHNNSNFVNPQLISGASLSIGAVYRFSNVFPNGPLAPVDALVRIEEFAGGSSLLDIDVTSSGLQEAFQPRINSTNDNDQSVLFNITFVAGGGNYGDEVVISYFATPFDIDGNPSDNTREYGEISLPDAYYVSNNTVLNVTQSPTVVRGEATNTTQAPGDDVSLDPTYTFSNYFENKSNFNYRIGKIDGNNDRYYSLDMDMASYQDPNSVLVTYPVICGQVTDLNGQPLANVDVDVTGSDGSSQTVLTDATGNYKAIAAIPAIFVDVVYEIRENDPTGYISISDVDGANDNLITRTINLASTCGNDFVDGFEPEITIDNQVDILCNGEATGSFSALVTGGLPPYTYTLNGGVSQSSPIFNNLTAGVYTVEVTDSLGNTASINVTLNEPEPLSVVITKENATTTQGCQDGEATATAAGGTAPYTYLWSASAGNQTTPTATNLPSGTHTVTITDANNCILEQGVVIDCSNTCDAIIAVDNITDVLCAGETTGSTTVSASSVANPTATFTFTWNTTPAQVDAGVTTSTLSGLDAGIYTVSVTIDGTVCQPVGQSVTIVEPSSALNVTASSTDESGPTTGDGTATATASGGTPPYAYSWSPSGETTEVITGLSAGTYTVTVTDFNGCTAIASTTVNPGTCLNLAVTANATSTTCNGDSDGTATANVNGGSGTFTYSWSPGGATTQTITGLTAGAYIITITDTVTQCTVQATATVNEPNSLSSGIAVSNVLCFGENTGSLDLTVSGGTFPYTFAWSNGATTEDINNLAAGTYNVTITDVNGCTTTDSATVNQPDSGIALTSTVVDVLCNGDSTGSIDITITGGTPPYIYAWNNGATTEDISNVSAGSYSVVVTDANGCSLTTNNIVINEPNNPLSVVITKENATTTQGCQDGEATAAAAGGTAPYTYLWSASAGNQTTQTATNLPVGLHTVTITDANDCILEQGVVIECTNTCDTIIAVDNITDVLCAGESTGSTTVSASSVANPAATFTFTWNTTPAQVDAGVTTSTLSGLGAGIYTVSVTIDGNVCQPVGQSVTIVEPATALNVSASASDESGPTTGDGTATATASGGTPPYTYSWSPGGATTEVITGLSAGTYTVTVTDFNGCTAIASTTVNPGICLNLAVTANATSTTCNGDSDGSATANVSGGSGTFTYSWSPGGATTQTITGLTAGAYTITITDTVTQCTVQATATVNEPNSLSSGIAVSNVLCFGEDTGSLDLTVSGGTFPYTFVWSNGATTEDINNLTAGTYDVTITDVNGCTTTDSATVLQTDAALTAEITVQTDIVCAAGLGSVTVEASGGTAPYSYNLDGGPSQNTGVFSDLNSGSYIVNIIDANGCSIQIPIEILANCTDAVTDINNTFVDTPVDGNVLTNDIDVEGDTQTVTTTTVITTQGVNVTIDPATGAYTYTPPMGYVGEDSFEYTICDNGNPVACDTATVYIEVFPNEGGPENLPPIANADTARTEVDTSVDGNVLTNDFDQDSDTITVTTTTVTTAEGVTVTIDPNTGEYTYTPPVGFTGEDTFEYTICDSGTPILCDTAIVVITVVANQGNLTVANDDAYNTTPGTAVSGNVSDNDSDPEGDNQVVNTTPVSGPSNGTLVLNPDGSFTYVPNDPSFVGTDQFVYSVCDDVTPIPACDQATVYITVGGGIANTTDAVTDINNTFVDTPVDGNVLTNDIDVEGDTQTVTTTTVITTQGVTVTIDPATGAYTYTPPMGYVGEDSFEYTICDNGNPVACDTATVYIEVFPNEGGPENLPPIANADTARTEVDTSVDGNVLTNDFDQDSDTITVTTTTVTTAEGVTVTIDPNTGEYTYTPPAGFTGEDTFEYTICDSGTPILCDTAIVVITVVANQGNLTVANDDAYNTTPGTAVSGNVSDNDSDPEGDNQVVNTTPVSGPSNGTLVLNPDGSFTYVPNDPSFVGTDQFVYSVCDDVTPIPACDQATVYITVGGGIANTTDAVTDINNTFVDTPVDGNVLTNDIDVEGDTQTVTTTTVITAQGVTVTIDPATGAYTYTPPMGYVGEDSFEYTICDNGNPVACDTATVYIEVFPNEGGPENLPPIANADTARTEVDTSVDGNVLTNDFDQDSDTITVTTTTVTTAEGVMVTIDPNTGEYTYTPPAGFTGEDTFEYTICDSGTPILCDTAIVVITVVANQGNLTVANDDAYFNNDCNTISGNVSDNDSDPEGDDQIVNTTPVSGPSNGTVVLSPDGTFSYTPNAGYLGTDSFVYSVCDDVTPVPACDQATVYISIIDTVPPDLSNCDVVDETIECSGADNETLANEWNTANIAALEACAFDSCDLDLNGQVTSNYAYSNLVSTCGLGGTIEVTYTVTDDSGNSTTLTVTLTLSDTTPPDVTNCVIEDMMLDCTMTDAQDIADQWNADNLEAIAQCATDSCNVNPTVLVASSYDFNDITDGLLNVVYTVTDECGNTSTINAMLALENTSVTANDASLCAESEVESQVFDLFDLLEGTYEGNGTWTVISAMGEIVDDHFFDPLSIELNGEDASENITFRYTENSSECPINVEATIEVHNRCAVGPCEDIDISTAITPNGDPFNEFFEITFTGGCNFPIDVKIVNRWGAIVFESNDYQNNWNGTAPDSSLGSAAQVPTGTYFYIVIVRDSGLRALTGPLYIGTK